MNKCYTLSLISILQNAEELKCMCQKATKKGTTRVIG